MTENKDNTPILHNSSFKNIKLSDLTDSFRSNKEVDISNNQISNIDTGGGNFQFGVFVAPNPSKITELIERSKSYAEDSLEYRDLIDELNNFQRPRDGIEIIGLENKLTNANMSSLLNDAKYLKDRAITRISKYQLQSHKAAVYTYIYAKVYEIFTANILPMITQGISPDHINQYISGVIVNPIVDEVCGADPTINANTVRGMLYILTGNCHLTWKQ